MCVIKQSKRFTVSEGEKGPETIISPVGIVHVKHPPHYHYDNGSDETSQVMNVSLNVSELSS